MTSQRLVPLAVWEGEAHVLPVHLWTEKPVINQPLPSPSEPACLVPKYLQEAEEPVAR